MMTRRNALITATLMIPSPFSGGDEIPGDPAFGARLILAMIYSRTRKRSNGRSDSK